MPLLSSLILLGWSVFWLYWLISAVGVKKNTTQKVNRFAGLRLVIFVIAVILIRTHSIGTNIFGVQGAAIHNTTTLSVGTILFVSGLSFAIWARLHLGNNWGMPMSLKQNPELVTSGPYRFVRHPIYTGILSAIFGTALAISFVWLILLVLAAVDFIYSALVEEKIMTREFPKAYPEYKQHTKMLIPFVY